MYSICEWNESCIESAVPFGFDLTPQSGLLQLKTGDKLGLYCACAIREPKTKPGNVACLSTKYCFDPPLTMGDYDPVCSSGQLPELLSRKKC